MKIGDVDDVEVNEDAAAGIAAQVKIKNDRDYFQEFIDVLFLIDTLTFLILDLPASDMRSLLPGGALHFICWLGLGGFWSFFSRYPIMCVSDAGSCQLFGP